MDSNKYKKQCEWLAEFYSEAARTGRGIQMFNHGPRVWEDIDIGPNMRSSPDEWRLKPEPQKAWVVWGDKGVFMLSSIKPDAEECRDRIKGILQEITRPEPQ